MTLPRRSLSHQKGLPTCLQFPLYLPSMAALLNGESHWTFQTPAWSRTCRRKSNVCLTSTSRPFLDPEIVDSDPPDKLHV